MKDFRLKRELQQDRVKNDEINDLITIVHRLEQEELPKLSHSARQRIEEQTIRPSKLPRIAAWSFAGGLATVTLVVISAQFAPKSSPFYAIKEGTDKIQALFQPSPAPQPVKTPNQESEKIELQSVNDPIAESPKNIKPEQPKSDSSHKKNEQTERSGNDNRSHSDQKQDKRDDDSGFLRRLFKSLTGDS